MGWTSVKLSIRQSPREHGREVVYRSAARALSQLGNEFGPTRASGEATEPAFLAILRGLVCARVALDNPTVDRLTAAWDAGEALKCYSNSFTYTTRAVRSAILAIIPSAGHDFVEGARVALQSAADIANNVAAVGRHSKAALDDLDVWREAEKDLFNLDRNTSLGSPLKAEYINSKSWKLLESRLIDFDPTWEVWVLWLRYRLLGLTREDTPPAVWPRLEVRLASQDGYFWTRSPFDVNTDTARYLVEEVDRLLNEEAEREQSRLGVNFYVDKSGRLDVLANSEDSRSHIRESVVKEVIKNVDTLIEQCVGNSSAHLQGRLIEYKDLFTDSGWSDDMLLVMRGDTLRKELRFQLSRDEDSDIPPLGQATLMLLEQTVRMHNMLVNAHATLAELDKMLLGPDVIDKEKPLANVRELIQSAEARAAISGRARDVIEQAVAQISPPGIANSSVTRLFFTANNMLRATIVFLWRQYRIVGSIGTMYAVGHWAIANRLIIEGWFSGNPIMSLILKRLFETLTRIPLL